MASHLEDNAVIIEEGEDSEEDVGEMVAVEGEDEEEDEEVLQEIQGMSLAESSSNVAVEIGEGEDSEEDDMDKADEDEPTQRDHGNTSSHPESQPRTLSPLPELPEAQRERRSKLLEETQNMFSKVSSYVTAEVQGAIRSLDVFEAVNKAAADKYSEMAVQAAELNISLQRVKEQRDEFAQYFHQIDDLEVAVGNLEEVIGKLDSYSKRLETRVKESGCLHV